MSHRGPTGISISSSFSSEVSLSDELLDDATACSSSSRSIFMMAPEEQKECFHKTMDTVELHDSSEKEQEEDYTNQEEEESVSLNDADVLNRDGNHGNGNGGGDSFVGSEIYVESADGTVSNTAEDAAAATAPPPLVPRETQAVKYVRMLFLAVMVTTTVIVAVMIYVSAERYEEDAFELAVKEQALAIGNSWTSHLAQQLTALQALGVSITSYSSYSTAAAAAAVNNASTWPLVTIPDFAQRVGPLASLVEGVMVLPLISDNTIRSSWEDYALLNQDWIQEGLATAEQASTSTSTNTRKTIKTSTRKTSSTAEDITGRRLQQNTTGIFETIFKWEEEGDDGIKTRVVEDSSPPFLPVWQSSPVQVDAVNYNMISQKSTLNASIDAALQSQLAVLSETLPESVWNMTTTTNISHPYHHFLFYPLFDGFGSDSQLVGLLATISVWESYFTTAAPPYSSPMVGVVDNNCGQTFTYQIQDSSVQLLGVGDYHDTQYNHYEITQDLSDLHYYEQGVSLLHDDPRVCDYVLRIYPTRDFENVYRSNRPGLYVVAVGVAFVAVLLSFWMYHCFVERRQTAVVKIARRSQAIVGSLFPSVVHDRLFTTQDHHQQQEEQKPRSSGNLTSMMMGGSGRRLSRSDRLNSSCNSIKLEPFNPLADVESKGGSSSLEHKQQRESLNHSFRSIRSDAPMQLLRTFLSQPSDADGKTGLLDNSKPIADLFPNATVMFADISGFTAWSSVREPAQVFTLLETIYSCFDKVAKKRKVFKVETIGDCYVAVTGLPDPQEDHAVVMAKFARECMYKMNELTRSLEVSLGPETGELSMRFGLNSGPVTAGVLRGEKSRFQLFGDTVNTASRMESTGRQNRIQVSQSTADLIIAAGKHSWVHPRGELVDAKGKGTVQTYWVTPRSAAGEGDLDNDSQRSSNQQTFMSESFVHLKRRHKGNLLMRDASTRRRSNGSDSGQKISSRRSLLSTMSVQGVSRRSLMSSNNSENAIWGADEIIHIDEGDGGGFAGYDANRQERLIEWNVDILSGLLKQIVAHRKSRKSEISNRNLELVNHKPNGALEEITEIIPFSESKPATTALEVDPATVDLPLKVESQLREYVTMVACMYRDNPFHNFEHAGHVTMSAQKLLKRVVMADEERVASDKEEAPSRFHDYAHSLSSDPLTQFAIVFSALIHDVDHTGVPNMQLVKEGAHIASLYKNKSVAEQNSLDLAWDLLMSPGYKSLQHCIFANPVELKRFRQMVVNVVIATDIFDADMKAIRNSRWEKAFCKDTLESPLSDEDDRNLKTTIVIEYIMQASDVSHTMQHWQVYSAWNEKLFDELYSAYKVNRAEKDPSIGWYNGELWFFDNYIIPLAKKLKECGVFGAASDECLTYALANREQWAKTGAEMVETFLSKHHNS